MTISDIEFLEVVYEESRIEGGLLSVAGAVASAGAIGTNQAFFSTNTNISNTVIESPSSLFTPFVATSISTALSTAFAS